MSKEVSLGRLEKTILLCGFIMHKNYYSKNEYVFFELVSMKTGISFLLRINSKYTISRRDSRPNDVSVKRINDVKMEETEEEIDFQKLDDIRSSMINTYKQIEAFKNELPTIEEVDIEKMNEDIAKAYYTNIKVDGNNYGEINECLKQLSRLNLCVKNLDYDIASTSDDYLCFIKYSEDPECYRLGEKCLTRMMLMADLDTFSAKFKDISTEVDKTMNGLYTVLKQACIQQDRNLYSNLSIILGARQVEKKREIFTVYDKYTNQIQKFRSLMEKSFNAESGYEKDLKKLDARDSEQGLSGNMNNAVARGNIRKKLDEVQSSRNATIESLTKIYSRVDSLLLNAERIFYDSAVLSASLCSKLKDLNKY